MDRELILCTEAKRRGDAMSPCHLGHRGTTEGLTRLLRGERSKGKMWARTSVVLSSGRKKQSGVSKLRIGEFE